MSESLKKTVQFNNVYQNGKSFANKYLVMYIIKNESDINRIGISVSKKVGNSVVRHRITRLIREGYRLNEEKFIKGYDIVIIARISSKSKLFNDISSSIVHLGNIHKIILKEYKG